MLTDSAEIKIGLTDPIKGANCRYVVIAAGDGKTITLTPMMARSMAVLLKNRADEGDGGALSDKQRDTTRDAFLGLCRAYEDMGEHLKTASAMISPYVHGQQMLIPDAMFVDELPKPNTSIGESPLVNGDGDPIPKPPVKPN